MARFLSEAESAFIAVVRTTLPRANVAVLNNEMTIEDWKQILYPVLPVYDEVPLVIAEIRNGATLRLAALMVAQATPRLEQTVGLEPGELITSIPHLAELFEAVDPEGLGLTADRYWLDNGSADPITFSGGPGERWFIRTVRAQTTFAMNFNETLRLICDSDLPVDGIDTRRMLKSAATSMEQTQLLYRDFHRGPDGSPMMTAEMFNDMRSWLMSVVVNGITYAPPNAAFIAPMASTDFLHGSSNPHHRVYIEKFLSLLPPSDQWALGEDMERPSIVTVFAQGLGYTDASALDDVPADELADRMLADPGLADNCEGLVALHDFYVGASGAHLGLVMKMLVRFDADLTHAERDKMSVKPDIGVGGNGIDHLRRLHDARRDAPGYAGLKRALKQLDGRAT